MNDDQDTDAASTLSKRLLYTPLKAVETGSTSIPKSLNEGSLVKFCRNVTVDYHRITVPSKNARNGGSRPLDTNAIEERIRHRIVSLLGSSKRNPNATKSLVPNTSRRRRKYELSKHQKGGLRRSIPQDSKEQLDFLERMQTKWQSYAQKLLLSGQKSLNSSSLNRISSILPTMELIGATVTIDDCAEKRNLEGKQGTVIGITKNTWTIAIRKCPQAPKSPTTSFKLVTIGKHKTVLSFVLDPAPPETSSLNKSGKVKVIVSQSDAFVKYMAS
jgi:RNase P/RNase MRP subunit p29